jgi:vancomycin resistance protein VanJ
MTQSRRPELADQFDAGNNTPQPKRPWRQKWTRLLRGTASVLCWLYLFGVLALWLFLYLAGDRWWPATMLLFGPRWALLLPLPILVPLCIAFRRRWIWGLLAIALLIIGPFMDLRITRLGLFPEDRQPSSVRVLTLNTHYAALDPAAFKKVIDETKPDVVALQEWYIANRAPLFSDPSWHTVQSDEAILASPYPIRMDGASLMGRDITAGVTYHYKIILPGRVLSFYSVHLSSPHAAFRNVLRLSRAGPRRLDLNSKERLREATTLHRLADDDTILAGDFNLPRDSTIYRSMFAGFRDAFSDAGLGYGLTYYSRWTAVRIDHVLMGKNWGCSRCWVGPDVGSPHRPVIADLVPSPN